MKEDDWTLNRAISLIRKSEDSQCFVEWNKLRIIRRLNRYNNLDTVKEQLNQLNDLSHYQRHKINTVSKYLERALVKIDDGTYGICTNYKCEIPEARLFHVPGAIRCNQCETTIEIQLLL